MTQNHQKLIGRLLRLFVFAMSIVLKDAINTSRDEGKEKNAREIYD